MEEEQEPEQAQAQEEAVSEPERRGAREKQRQRHTYSAVQCSAVQYQQLSNTTQPSRICPHFPTTGLGNLRQGDSISRWPL